MIKILGLLLVAYALMVLNFQFALCAIGVSAFWWGLTTNYWETKQWA